MNVAELFHHQDELTEDLAQYLIFKLGQEVCAVDISEVFEIVEVPQIAGIPKAPKHMKGVMNLRGNVIPVIDTRLKFGMEEYALTEDSCVIVMNNEDIDGGVVFGALVDAVDGVFDIADTALKPATALRTNYPGEYIKNMIKLEENRAMLLDVPKVFAIESDDEEDDLT